MKISYRDFTQTTQSVYLITFVLSSHGYMFEYLCIYLNSFQNYLSVSAVTVSLKNKGTRHLITAMTPVQSHLLIHRAPQNLTHGTNSILQRPRIPGSAVTVTCHIPCASSELEQFLSVSLSFMTLTCFDFGISEEQASYSIECLVV
jgi:hypothetical protein